MFRGERLWLFLQTIHCTGIPAFNPHSNPTGQMGKPRHREVKFLVPAGNWQSRGISPGLGCHSIHSRPGLCAGDPRTCLHQPSPPGHCNRPQAPGKSEGQRGVCSWPRLLPPEQWPSMTLPPVLLCRGGLWPSPEAFSPHAWCWVEDGLVPRWPWAEPISVYIGS